MLAVTLALASLQAVTVSTSEDLVRTMRAARPGAVIHVAPGTYRGGFSESLNGEPDRPIIIRAADPKNPPKIVGGGSGIHLTDSSYVELRDLVIEKATGNGINIDDGGTFDSPSHNIKLVNLRVTDLPPGNHDGIKLSGVRDFVVENCTVERWGGSGIDMVGCHSGTIRGSTFRHGGDSGLQAKGGSKDILISQCRFEEYGQRGVNVGGSTGMQFFRWPSPAPREKFEAKEITIADCTFIGGVAPLAFVGVDGAAAVHNTIFHPKRWAMRILQETREPSFVPTRNVRFEKNLVVFRSDQWFEGGINVGDGTSPESFRFIDNFWFCSDRPERSQPKLPTKEIGGIVGKDPQLGVDLRPSKGSIAAPYGARRE